MVQDTRYKSIYWQPCRLDCHIHNTQYNTGIIKNIYTYINKFELVQVNCAID